MTFSELLHPATPVWVPAWTSLKKWRERRLDRRLERLAIARLASLSPHLLEDIGMGPVAPPPALQPEFALRGSA